METTDEEIQTITNQLKDWSVQIIVLRAKQDVATATARKFARELDELHTKQHAVAQQLRDVELHKSGMYMWENIGCGG